MPVPSDGEVRLGLLEVGEDPLGVGDQALTGAGQPDPPPVALEQRHARLALELRELLADRRGRHPQRLGGSGDRAARGYLSEHSESLNVEHK